MPMNKAKVIAYLHVLMMMILTATILTAVFNTTLFSKENIMEIIDYALAVTHIEMSPVDSIFIARVIRQQLWEVHFYIGIFLPVIAMLIYLTFNKKSKTAAVTKNMAILNIIILFITT